jgi:hypothetical protein
MADNQLDWSVWDSQISQTAPGPTYSKVDSFQKQTFSNDKVGGIEKAIMPKVASALQKGQKSKATGWLLNPALRVMENVYKRVIQPTTEGISTAVLTAEATKKYPNQGVSGLVKSFKFAKEQSKKISMGQAVATTIGQGLGDVLPDQITPKFMDKNFDIFDDKQRNKAFRDEWSGIIASGGTDLAIAALGTKGVGSATKAATKKALGAKKIVTIDDMNTFKAKADEAVAWADAKDGTPAPSGLAVLIDDAVKETNLTKLATNPLVSETSNPGRTATILSRLDNHADVANYLKAERGDVQAFDSLFKAKPVLADHIDNYGINNFDPIGDWTKIHLDTLDPKMTARYQAIIDGKKASDPKFAAALDDFKSKLTSGVVESYQPGRFGKIENLGLQKKKLSLQAKYGDVKLFGEDGGNSWKTQVYQSEAYDRTIRMISWAGSGRPQGHINISNPRKFEASSDLLSDLNRLRMLRTPEGMKFKRDQVERFMAAQDDTQRAIALANIEKNVMTYMANHYKVSSIGDIRTSKEAVDQITRWHVGTSERRQTLQQYAVKNGLIPDEDGVLNVSNFWSVSNEAQTVPMLDFGRLENEVIRNVDRLAMGASPISKADINLANLNRLTTGIGSFLDTANMVFNNLNLLRFAYIPKNSMVDPFARGSMAMESTELIGNSMPGVKNIIHNQSLRNESLKRYVPGTAGAASRRAEKDILKQMDILGADLNKAILPWEDAQKAFDQAEKVWQAARTAQTKAAAAAQKASGSAKAQAEAAMHQADYALYEAQKVFYEAENALTRTGERVQGLSTVIEKHRAKIKDSAIYQGTLAQRKRLGQEAETIIVNGKEYKIAGLADPNIRGANAYMSEVDSAQNFYSTAMQSEYGRRLRAEGSRFVTIKRSEGKPYWNALAHIANRQVRNELDMPLGMIMRGESDQSVLQWLYKNDAGKEYRRRMSSRAGHELSQEEFSAWIAQTGEKLRAMYPSQELRDVILERPVTVKEVETLLKNRPDLLETIDGPNINLNDLNKYERAVAGVSGVLDTGWKILSATETRMVRNPMFLSYTREELKTLINAAQRSGIDVTDAVVNNQLRQIAYRNALSRVEQTLYSSRRLTNGMYAARYAMSFPLAFFNSQTVALRLMAKNPMNAYWYNSVANGLANYHPYEDKDGNTYASMADVPAGTKVSVKQPLPFGDKLPKWAKDALKPYTDSRGGGLKWNPKQMEFMVADPSVSWFGTVEISNIVKNGFSLPGGLWSIHGEDVAKNLRNFLGDDVYESSVLYGGYPTEGKNIIETAKNTVVPSYLQSLVDSGKVLPGVKQLLDAIGVGKSDRFVDEVFTNFRTAYAEWDREGRVGEPPTMEMAAKAAGNMSFIRAVTQFFAPIATTFDPVTRAATEYYAMLLKENNGNYDLAQMQMEKEWGVDSLALIGSNQKNIAGVASTFEDIKMLRNNPEILTKLGRSNPKYAQMLSAGYGDISTDYSTEIAAIYKTLKFPGSLTPITEKKTDIELRQEIEAKRGWADYNKAAAWRDAMMYQYGVTSTSSVKYQTSGIQQAFDSMVNQIIQDFPGWETDRNSGRKDFEKQTLPAIKAIANDPKWRGYADNQGAKWQEIAYWSQQAEEFYRLYNLNMNSPQRQYDLKAQFSQFHFNYMQGASDEFNSFAQRWLEVMPELDIGKVVG